MIRVYEMRRGDRKATVKCCERHLEARMVLGWKVRKRSRKPFGPCPVCDDCEDAKRTSTVLARAVEATEQEPEPVPVLPGQRRLF